MCHFEYKNTILDGDQQAHGRPYPPLCNPFSIASSTIHWYDCTRTHTHTRYVYNVYMQYVQPFRCVDGLSYRRIRATIFNIERVKVYVLPQSRRNPRKSKLILLPFVSVGSNAFDKEKLRRFFSDHSRRFEVVTASGLTEDRLLLCLFRVNAMLYI